MQSMTASAHSLTLEKTLLEPPALPAPPTRPSHTWEARNRLPTADAVAPSATNTAANPATNQTAWSSASPRRAWIWSADIPVR